MTCRLLKTSIALVAASAGLAALLAGCGGSNNSDSLPASGTALPVAYGRQIKGPAKGYEASGLGTNAANGGNTSTNPSAGDTPYFTFAFSSNSTPLGGAVLLGYLGLSPNGAYVDQAGVTNPAVPAAVAPSAANVFFRATVAEGTDPTSGQQIPIANGGVTLTSPELGTTWSEPMTLNYTAGTAAGPFTYAQYVSPPFTLPFTTPGVHILRVTVKDIENNAPHTDYAVIVLDNSTAAAVVTIPSTATASISGAISSIPSYTSTPANPTTAIPDNQGVVVLFATPGTPDGNGNTNTISIDNNGTISSVNVALTTGQVTVVPASETQPSFVRARAARR